MIRSGQPYGSLGKVTGIGSFDVAEGGHWTSIVSLERPIVNQALLEKGVAIAHYNGPTDTPGITYNKFFPPQISDAGLVASPGLVDPIFIYLSGFFLDQQLVLLGGDTPQAPELAPGLTFRVFQAARLNRAETILACDLQDASGFGPQTLLRLEPNSNTPSQSVIVQTGDILPGLPGPVVNVADDLREFDLSDNGNLMFLVHTEGGLDWVLLNGEVVLREDDPIEPLGYTLDQVFELNTNDRGDWAVNAWYDTPAGDRDYVLVKNGELLAYEGGPGPHGFLFTSFGGVLEVADSGSTLYRAVWDDPDLSRNEGLFLDERLIVQEGVTVVEGELLTRLGTATLSDDGRTLLFSGGLGEDAGASDVLMRADLSGN